MSTNSHIEIFNQKIANGQSIEPNDWMPDDYREAVAKVVGFHAAAEIVSYGPFFQGWATKAPSLRRKMIINAFIQDELGHGQVILRAWESLGFTYQDMIDRMRSGKIKMLNIFLYPIKNWSELTVLGMLADSVELDRLGSLTHCSYGPYARGLVKIVKEEAFHFRQSCDAVKTIMLRGTDEQRQDLQGALNNWWSRTIDAYGPSDKKEDRSRDVYRWKVKIKTNDELRQAFLKRTKPLFDEWGLIIPDPNLRFDEQKKEWDYTYPEADNFKRLFVERKAESEQYTRYAEISLQSVRRDQPLLPANWRKELAWT